MSSGKKHIFNESVLTAVMMSVHIQFQESRNGDAPIVWRKECKDEDWNSQVAESSLQRAKTNKDQSNYLFYQGSISIQKNMQTINFSNEKINLRHRTWTPEHRRDLGLKAAFSYLYQKKHNEKHFLSRIHFPWILQQCLSQIRHQPNYLQFFKSRAIFITPNRNTFFLICYP